MDSDDRAVIDRFRLAGAGFGTMLRNVQDGDWERPTPCPAWSVRQLVNHVTRGNLNYTGLVHGATARTFLERRDDDALGADPFRAFAASVEECACAYERDGVLERVLDYPLGPVTGRQALAVRTADTLVHTWDLARAIDADDRLDPGLVGWMATHLEQIYAGLAETPTDPAGTHRFFAAPTTGRAGSGQDRLLARTGRDPAVHVRGRRAL